MNRWPYPYTFLEYSAVALIMHLTYHLAGPSSLSEMQSRVVRFIHIDRHICRQARYLAATCHKLTHQFLYPLDMPLRHWTINSVPGILGGCSWWLFWRRSFSPIQIFPLANRPNVVYIHNKLGNYVLIKKSDYIPHQTLASS